MEKLDNNKSDVWYDCVIIRNFIKLFNIIVSDLPILQRNGML